jgi:hypothetical protein
MHPVQGSLAHVHAVNGIADLSPSEVCMDGMSVTRTGLALTACQSTRLD